MDADGQMLFIRVYQRASVVQFLRLRLAALGFLCFLAAKLSEVSFHQQLTQKKEGLSDPCQICQRTCRS
jgi:hypothetical protein